MLSFRTTLIFRPYLLLRSHRSFRSFSMRPTCKGSEQFQNAQENVPELEHWHRILPALLKDSIRAASRCMHPSEFGKHVVCERHLLWIAREGVAAPVPSPCLAENFDSDCVMECRAVQCVLVHITIRWKTCTEKGEACRCSSAKKQLSITRSAMWRWLLDRLCQGTLKAIICNDWRCSISTLKRRKAPGTIPVWIPRPGVACDWSCRNGANSGWTLQGPLRGATEQGGKVEG